MDPGMVFGQVLKDLVDHVPGALAAMVMGYDGIPLDQYSPSGSTIDLSTIAIEYCHVITNIKKNAEHLGAQDVEEITIRTKTWTILIRLINQDYFVILALNSHAFFGKGRYLLRNVASQVLSQL